MVMFSDWFMGVAEMAMPCNVIIYSKYFKI